MELGLTERFENRVGDVALEELDRPKWDRFLNHVRKCMFFQRFGNELKM